MPAGAPIEILDIPLIKTLTDASAAIVKKMAEGQISPEEAASTAAVVERAIEAIDLKDEVVAAAYLRWTDGRNCAPPMAPAHEPLIVARVMPPLSSITSALINSSRKTGRSGRTYASVAKRADDVLFPLRSAIIGLKAQSRDKNCGRHAKGLLDVQSSARQACSHSRPRAMRRGESASSR
jgi:hypothetical protein